MSNLKPCPFCGGEAQIDRMGTNKVSMQISCSWCGASLETGETWIDEDSEWNTRDNKQAKRQAITELLALHEQGRAKVNSQCDTLINMSTVRKYLEGL